MKILDYNVRVYNLQQSKYNSDILILGIIDLPELGGSNLIKKKGYAIQTLIDY